MERWWIYMSKEKLHNRRRKPTATLFITNPTQNGLGQKPGMPRLQAGEQVPEAKFEATAFFKTLLHNCQATRWGNPEN
jgi:hypothetical protein